MGSTSVRRDIDALIEAAAEDLCRVQDTYEVTLREKEASAKLQVRMKNVLENQRATLDYLANAIVDSHGTSGQKAYWPMARHPNEFPNLFGSRLPGVPMNPPHLYDVICQRQPYHPDYDWLGHLSLLTNENKHRRLTPQTRTEALELRSGPGGGIIGTGGARIALGEGASIRLGGGASIRFGGPGPVVEHNIVRTIYVDWLLADLGISALGTLQRIQRELPRLVQEVLHASGL